jgi:hypothetical protein
MIHSNGLHTFNSRSLSRSAMPGLICEHGKIWGEHMQYVAGTVHHLAVSVLRARVFWGTPAFFQFERMGPVHQRLGPGLSRESDSFWVVSEW